MVILLAGDLAPAAKYKAKLLIHLLELCDIDRQTIINDFFSNGTCHR